MRMLFLSHRDIINKLREAVVLASQGKTIEEISRGLGITSQTYCSWRKVYGGMKVDQAKRLKELERDDVRLRKVVAE